MFAQALYLNGQLKRHVAVPHKSSSLKTIGWLSLQEQGRNWNLGLNVEPGCKFPARSMAMSGGLA